MDMPMIMPGSEYDPDDTCCYDESSWLDLLIVTGLTQGDIEREVRMRVVGDGS